MEPQLETNPAIKDVLEALKQREPIFHHPDTFGTTRNDIENQMDDAFWEIGASGRRYSREFIIETLLKRYNDPTYVDICEASDFHCLEIAPDNFLLTYTLAQGPRITRRATLWRRIKGNWKIVYHQGTVVEK